jgi:hypothetical protein
MNGCGRTRSFRGLREDRSNRLNVVYRGKQAVNREGLAGINFVPPQALASGDKKFTSPLGIAATFVRFNGGEIAI